MRVLFLVNPVASSVTARRRLAAARILAADCDLRLASTRSRGHATVLAEEARHDGTDAVVVLGGDGTLAETVTALAGSTCAVGALPGGSTNVFARTIGLPDDVIAAAGLLNAGLRSGSSAQMALGTVNGRNFCLHVGVGWDAALVRSVERRAHLKRHLGHALFIWAGLMTLCGGYDRRHPHFSAQIEEEDPVEEAFFTLVMNSDPYTYVGHRPFTVAPQADRHGGLSVVTMTRLGLRDIAAVALDALSDRRGISESDHVIVRHGVRHLTVRRLDGAGFHNEMGYQLDGDYLGEVDALEFSHHRDAIRLVVPPPRCSDAPLQGHR